MKKLLICQSNSQPASLRGPERYLGSSATTSSPLGQSTWLCCHPLLPSYRSTDLENPHSIDNMEQSSNQSLIRFGAASYRTQVASQMISSNCKTVALQLNCCLPMGESRTSHVGEISDAWPVLILLDSCRLVNQPVANVNSKESLIRSIAASSICIS